jgi:hypothetical protein
MFNFLSASSEAIARPITPAPMMTTSGSNHAPLTFFPFTLLVRKDNSFTVKPSPSVVSIRRLIA